MFNTDEILRKKFEEVFGTDSIMYKGNGSICSTCKHFNGESCTKRISFADFAYKLSDCNEWKVCN